MAAPETFPVSPELIEALGLPSLETLCAKADIAPSTAMRTEDFFRLWTVVEAHLTDRAAGLRFGAEGIERGYGVAALVALHAPDLRHALASLSRYKRLTCPELVEVEMVGDEAIVRYRWLLATGPAPRLLVDTTLASLHALTLRGTGNTVAPLRIELARRASDRDLLCAHFGCPVVFGAAHDAMVFARSALDTPFVTADGGAFARLLVDLEARLATGEGFASPMSEVRVTIARQLSEGRAPTLAAVARRMAWSARTLQRRLHDDRTSFQAQLAAVRHTTANRLLTNTALDPTAIAMLLGFVEPNSFVRAFHAWEQTTPLRWRARHAASQKDAP